jgi:tetratricopeptide (TPR) repeat protein
MKSTRTYYFLLFAFALFTLLIIKYRDNSVVKEVMLRQGVAGLSSEYLNVQASIDRYRKEIKNNPNNLRAKISLALAYIQQSRNSADHSFYDNSALTIFEEVLTKEPENFEALTGKATVLLSQHHFSEALEIAMKAKVINPYNAIVYGVLTDAYTELGDYNNAVYYADKMVSVRPDIRSYSRVSYLREIHGDYTGAINAMNMAVEAGYPGFEQTEWCRVQLGNLFELTGEPDKAKQFYQTALYYRPASAFACAGLGRVCKAKNNYTEAISYFRKALSLQQDFSFQQELTELYRLNNEPEQAHLSAKNTIEMLAGINGEESNTVHGHYAGKELAQAYVDACEFSNAYKSAFEEYNRRPGNIDVNQVMAWVNYKMQKYQEADKYINTALRTNSKNPVLNFQAGLIKLRCGEKDEGLILLKKAIDTNPFLSPLLKWEEKMLFASL